MAITILATDLAELARPVGQDTGKTGVRQAGIGGAAAAIEAAANGPAAIEAVFGIGIEAESMLGLEENTGGNGKLVAGAPEKLGGGKEGMVDGGPEGLPGEGGMGGIEVGEKILGIKRCSDSSGVVAAGIGTAEIDIGGFAEVAVEAKMADNTD